MRTVLTEPETDQISHGREAAHGRGAAHGREAAQGRRRRCWPLAVMGLALLVTAIVMMAIGAQPSRAQTVHPRLAPAQLAPLRSPDGLQAGAFGKNDLIVMRRFEHH